MDKKKFIPKADKENEKKEDEALEKKFEEETAEESVSKTEDEIRPKEQDKNEIEELRRKNEQLTRELEEIKKQSSRLEKEISEFSEMFPDIPLSEIPDEIWSEVKKGLPLSASYARHERKRTNAEKRANDANAAARELTSGSIGRSEENYYSPEDVRKMSASEVKKNYSHIINSMKHWN
ncbi:MAG: hypothetical protein U0M06_03745 [Clostridia bacterium]|nr:hypothetical protein [Clostridia bacterium]